MSRRPLRFRENDLRRAIRAATKEGVTMAVEISPDGLIRMTPAPLTVSATPPEVNTWDK